MHSLEDIQEEHFGLRAADYRSTFAGTGKRWATVTHEVPWLFVGGAPRKESPHLLSTQGLGVPLGTSEAKLHCKGVRLEAEAERAPPRRFPLLSVASNVAPRA